MYGGYTQSMTGDSTGNEVVLKNISPSTTGHFYIYGGWSKNGKATGNTITLESSGGYSTGYGMYGYAHLNGGYSGKTGATTADNTAGNTLKVTAKDSGAATVENFEKLKFVLGDNVASGDTMLYIRDNMQNFDWTKITVDNALILSRTVDKFLTRKRTLKKSQQWSHRTVDVSPSEEAHRLMNKFDGCSNSS